ncbi:Serpin B8 [Chionoecetes opilio]|uniref:Serpin B8 n=1 Tax=Chionoecetes opilio TaxID=41210 RepID=A0A8J4XXN9_CHIOP|nr:Serpin B8 [Chionoecetes opilio]
MRGALVLLAAAAACVAMPDPQRFRPDARPLRGAASRGLHGAAFPLAMMGKIIHEFGLDLSVELQKTGNVVISPLSISALLSVLLLGSAGHSHLQIRRGLHFEDYLAEEDIHVSFQRLLDAISNNGPHVTLNIANGLFLQKGAGIIYNFTQDARTHYNSVVSTLDFKNSSVAATETINKWVEQSTSGMIPRLYKNSLDPMTTFVAVNTVFFNGTWLSPFTPAYTKDRDFDTGAEKIKVPMMSGTLNVKYVDIPEYSAHMAALSYQGSRQAMYIILPKEKNVTANLEPLEQLLSAENVNNLIKKMTSLQMRVWLPRMRLTFKTSLRKALTNLRMDSIFKPAAADFSRLSSEQVWVNDVVHETVIEVTEEGTRAAAATGSDFNRMGTSRVFIVDRPAIFFIRDEESGVPLFWGRLVKPEALRG